MGNKLDSNQKRMAITHEHLKARLAYNPLSGVFSWLERPREDFRLERSWRQWNNVWAGQQAGHADKSGYVRINIEGRVNLAHRLAFLFINGCYPEYDVDHINGVRSDNRWENLRAVNRLENRRNAAISKNNTSGVLGVSQVGEKWEAKICINGRTIHLGKYSSLDAAAKVRRKADLRYGFHQNHGREQCQA